MKYVALFIALLCCCFAFPGKQDTTNEPKFYLTIKLSEQQNNTQIWLPNRASVEGASVETLINNLFGVNKAYVAGQELYPACFVDIIFSSNLPREQHKKIVRNALLSMFDLEAKFEEVEAEVVVFGKPKRMGNVFRTTFESHNSIANAENFIVQGKTNISAMMRTLEEHFSLPCVDETGLKGSFSWELRIDPRMTREEMLKEIESRLGLVGKIEKRRVKKLVISDGSRQRLEK